MVNETFVKKTAKLAYISLTPNEVDHLKDDLTRILSFVDELLKVDTTDTEPLINPAEVPMPLREDVVTAEPMPEKVLQNAPTAAQNFFLLPKIISQEI